MKIKTNVNTYLVKHRQNHSSFSSWESFDVELKKCMYGLNTKQSTISLIYLAYSFPEYTRATIRSIDAIENGPSEVAVLLYRRILVGAVSNRIYFSDIFPGDSDYWYAPWCDGFLSRRPIAHNSIRTFCCPDTGDVSFLQLMNVEKYENPFGKFGCDDENDEDAIDLEDSDNYEDDEPQFEFSDSGDDFVPEECDIVFQSEIPSIAANIIDHVDKPLFQAYSHECLPLYQEFLYRASVVANSIEPILQHPAYHDCDPHRVARLCEAIRCVADLENPSLDTSCISSVKSFFAVYPFIQENGLDESIRKVRLRSYINNKLMVNPRKIYVPFSWNDYGQYPMALLSFLGGEISLFQLQASLLAEFGGTEGRMSSVMFAESSVLKVDDSGGIYAASDPIYEAFSPWADRIPCVIACTNPLLLAKCDYLEMVYPDCECVVTSASVKSHVLDLRRDSNVSVSLKTIDFPDKLWSLRTNHQVGVVAAFLMKAAFMLDPLLVLKFPSQTNIRGIFGFQGPKPFPYGEKDEDVDFPRSPYCDPGGAFCAQDREKMHSLLSHPDYGDDFTVLCTRLLTHLSEPPDVGFFDYAAPNYRF